MTGELITTGVTFGAGRNSINDAFSGTAEFNNIALDSGADFSGGTGGGVIYSGGTDLYNIFGTGGGTSADLFSASTGTGSIIANNGTGNLASGLNTVVAGGNANRAIGNYSVVGAGYTNMASGDGSFIGAGLSNSATTSATYSSVVGGRENIAQGNTSFIAGGGYNQAIGNYSSIIGGSVNTATGIFSLVAGYGNTVSASHAAVIGGQSLLNNVDNSVMVPHLTVDGNLSAGTGGAIYSGGTDLYNIFSTGGGGSTTAGNGLTKTGDNITFGGTLTGDTSIAIGTSGLLIDGGSSGYFVLSGDSAVDNQFTIINKNSNQDASLVVQAGKALLSGQNSAGSRLSLVQATAGVVPGVLMQIFNGLASSSMLIQESAMTISDNINLQGINYDANYHANYVNRTLVDYEYVNNHVASAVTSNSTYDYGTTGTTLGWDVSNDSKSAKVILSGNVTLDVLNVSSGDFGTLEVKQDAVGSRTITLGAGTHRVANGGAGSITLTATANAVDIINFFYNGAEFNWSVGNDYN